MGVGVCVGGKGGGGYLLFAHVCFGLPHGLFLETYHRLTRSRPARVYHGPALRRQHDGLVHVDAHDPPRVGSNCDEAAR